MELRYEELTLYAPMEWQAVTREETLETSIPEYCPDMSRIVDAVGELTIRDKTVSEEGMNVTGAVKVTVLYASEEVPGLKSLTMSVPFTCRMDDRSITRAAGVCFRGKVVMLEAKAVTSRRLYLRVLPEITATGCRAIKQKLCVGTEEDASIRTKVETLTIPVLTGAAEQEFSYAGETMLTTDMPEDLLLYRLYPRVDSTQRVGNKLMVKGSLWFSALYRSDSALLSRYETDLPFSQIVEAGDLPESAQHVVTARIYECDARLLRNDEGGGFGVTARIALCIRAYEEKKLSYLWDLYSTKCATRLQQQPITLPLCRVPHTLTEDAALLLEDRTNVFVTSLDCTPAAVTMEGGRPMLRTSVHVTLLYQDDDGAPMAGHITEEVTVPAEGEASSVMAWAGETQVNCSADCRIRIPVNFTVCAGGEESLHTITAVETEEDSADKPAPSLVLRRMREGETLWDVAKQYRTDMDAIRHANHMEGDTTDRMLLIPRVR